MDSIKLQKYFSDCGILSRRAAEEEIKQGKVTVNGEAAFLGMRISPDVDVVIYKGARVLAQSDEKLYILLNKPRGIVTTLSDEKGRPTVLSLISGLGARVYPVGRLDIDSDGLLLLTNDGALTNKLTHPRHKIPKIYNVTVKGEVTEGALTLLSSPLVIDGYKIQPVKVEIIKKEPSQTILKMTLYEGRNRQIRKMCALADLKITRLTRVALGNIALGSLEVGKWRFLTQSETDYLLRESK
ncbi:MAG: rRNA pseudouridine synthase [Clostridia bacterium]|nr:rRNA pseudouridine synthase [Clostridia bacterium]